MRTRIVIAAGGALAVAASTGALAAGFDPDDAPRPWSHRCPIEIKAYEDGSASLYCGAHRRPFGVVDAESGRIRFFLPR